MTSYTRVAKERPLGYAFSAWASVVYASCTNVAPDFLEAGWWHGRLKNGRPVDVPGVCVDRDAHLLRRCNDCPMHE
jgi:hypothetical protein